MATREGIGELALEGIEHFDAIAKEIEDKFSSYHSLLEARKSDLLEKVKEMRELYQKHQELEKAIEQLEGIKRETNEMLTENLVAANKEESVNYWDDKIMNLKKAKNDLEVVSNLKLVVNSEDYSKCLKRIHLREIEAVEYSKRREPIVMKVERGCGEGQLIFPNKISLDDTTNEVFVTFVEKSEILVYSPEGDIVRKNRNEELKDPQCICAFKGFLFVSNGNFVFKFNKDNEIVKKIDFQDSTGQLRSPGDLCVHKECVYVCSSDDTIEMFDLNLNFVKSFGKEELKEPRCIKTLNEQIFVFQSNDSIQVFNMEHNYLRSIPLKGQEILSAAYFTMDRRGNFIVSDFFDHCLKVFDPSGEYVDTLGEGFLLLPCGVVTDNKERIIVICHAEINCFQVY